MLPRTKGHRNEALHLIPPLRGDLPLKGKACGVLLRQCFQYTMNAALLPSISSLCGGVLKKCFRISPDLYYPMNVPLEIIGWLFKGFPWRGSWRRCRVSDRDRQRRLMRWIEAASSIPAAIISQPSTSSVPLRGTPSPQGEGCSDPTTSQPSIYHGCRPTGFCTNAYQRRSREMLPHFSRSSLYHRRRGNRPGGTAPYPAPQGLNGR